MIAIASSFRSKNIIGNIDIITIVNIFIFVNTERKSRFTAFIKMTSLPLWSISPNIRVSQIRPTLVQRLPSILKVELVS